MMKTHLWARLIQVHPLEYNEMVDYQVIKNQEVDISSLLMLIVHLMQQ